MKNSILKNYIYNNILLLINMVYPLIINIYINRLFELEQIGNLMYYLSIVSVFITLSNLGMLNYASKQIAIVKNHSNLLKKKFSELFILNMLSSLFFFFLFLVFFFFFDKEKKNMLYIVLSLNILGNIFNIEWFFIGIEDFGFITKRSILIKIVVLLLVILLIKDSQDFNKYIILLIVGMTGNNLLNIKYIFNYFHKQNFLFYLRRDLKILKDLKFYFFQVVIGAFSNGLDQTLLGFNSTMIQVAYYSRIRQVTGILLMISTSFLKVIISKTNNYKEKDKEKYEKLLEKSMAIILIFIIPFTVMGILFSKNILIIIGGEKFIEASNSLKIMSIVILMTGLSVWYNYQICIPLKEEKIIFKALIFLLVISLGIGYIFNSKYGALGMASGIVIGEIVNFFIIIRSLILKGIKVLYVKKEFLSIIFSTIISTIVSNYLFMINSYNTYISIVLLGFYMSVYFILLILIDSIFYKAYLKNIILEEYKK